MPRGQVGEAVQRADDKWEVQHADGSTEVLSDKQFHQQYDVEEKVVAADVKPETVDVESFPEDEDYIKRYCDEIESELKCYEEGIKIVRDEIKATKKSKGENGFGALRRALHNLSHGNPVSRVANPAQVPHDGPERLQPAPTAEDNVCSGPGEETNFVESRHAGR